jgi:hypothetical protein
MNKQYYKQAEDLQRKIDCIEEALTEFKKVKAIKEYEQIYITDYCYSLHADFRMRISPDFLPLLKEFLEGELRKYIKEFEEL